MDYNRQTVTRTSYCPICRKKTQFTQEPDSEMFNPSCPEHQEVYRNVLQELTLYVRHRFPKHRPFPTRGLPRWLADYVANHIGEIPIHLPL